MKIKFICGCMKSGKSAHLIMFYRECDKKNIEAFKPDIDTRDGDFIVSRAFPDKIPCKRIKDVRDVLMSDKDIILIDEYQFFQKEQLEDTLKALSKTDKTVIIAGLDRLHNGEYWTNFEAVKKYVTPENMIQLKAVCEECGAAAEYTKLKSLSDSLIQIETELTTYIPTCEECFMRKEQ